MAANIAVQFVDQRPPRMEDEFSPSRMARNHIPLFLTGERINGRVQVTVMRNELERHVGLMDVTFEGLLRTAISRDISKVERRHKLFYLTDSRRLTNEAMSSGQSSHCRKLSCRFHFVVPDRAISLEDNAISRLQRPDFHVLPPSLRNISETTFAAAEHCGSFRGECHVTYRLRFRVISDTSRKVVAETVHQVLIFPGSKEVAPPLCVSDFPREYTMSVTQPVSKMLRTPLSFSEQTNGKMTVRTTEPTPLVFSRFKSWSATSLHLNLEYWQRIKCPEGVLLPPPIHYATVKLALQASTFFSVLIPRNSALPLQRDTAGSPWTISTNQTTSHQARKLQFLPWRNKKRIHTDDGHEHIIWSTEASLVAPFERDKSPGPTFASTFVSRRYAFQVGVAVEGLRKKLHFTLRVPVQVCYQSSEMMPVECANPFVDEADSEISTSHDAEPAAPVDQPPLYTAWRRDEVC